MPTTDLDIMREKLSLAIQEAKSHVINQPHVRVILTQDDAQAILDLLKELGKF